MGKKKPGRAPKSKGQPRDAKVDQPISLSLPAEVKDRWKGLDRTIRIVDLAARGKRFWDEHGEEITEAVKRLIEDQFGPS